MTEEVIRTEPDPATAWLTGALDLLGPYAVRTASALRLADHVAAGHTEVTELARQAGTAPEATARLLRYLAARGVFKESAPGEFVLTPAAELLLSDNPRGVHQPLNGDGTRSHIERAYPRLESAVRTGRPAYAGGFYAHVHADPERAAAFAAVTARRTAATAEALAQAYDWSSVGTVVDVGGGDGTLLAELLRRHPGLRGTVLDLPETAALAERRFAAEGLDGRGRAVGGSYRGRLPAADAYVVANILMDCPDDEARQVLRGCRAAGGAGARVLCVDPLTGGEGAPEGASELHTLIDLHGLLLTGGRLRDQSELDEMAASVGLRAASSRELPTGYLMHEYRIA